MTESLYAVQGVAGSEPLASGKPHPILPVGAARNDAPDARDECARSVTARRDGQLPDVLTSGERVRVQGNRQALIASRSHPGDWHNVSFEEPNEANGKDEWVCSCEGFQFRHECRHVRALDRWAAGLAIVEGLLFEPEEAT